MDFPFGAIVVLILSIGFFCLLTGWRGALFLGSITGGIISLVCEESTMFLICLIVCVVSFGLMASHGISTPQGPLTTENNNPKLSESEVFKTLANSKNKSSNKNNETTKSKTSKEVKEKLYVVNYQNPDNPEEVATKSSVRNPKWLMEKLNLGFELKDFEVEPFEIRKGIDKVALGKFLHSKETQEVEIKNNENTENVVTDKKPSKKAKKEVEQEITTVCENYLPALNNEEKAKKLENIEEAYYQALSDVEKFYNEHANYDVPSVSLIKREINKFEKIWSQFKDYNSDEDIAQEQQTWVMRLKELVGKSQNSNVNLDSNNNQKKKT